MRQTQDAEPDDPVARAAASWFVRRMDGELGSDEEVALDRWLRADRRHAAAFAAIERAWGAAGAAGDALRGPPRRAALSRRGAAKAMIGLGVLGAAGGAGWALVGEHPFADFRTARGDRRSVHLPDGTTIDMSTRSALSVRYAAAERRLILHAGEAFFQVAAEPNRPFVVEAGNGETTALGTAFGIQCRPDDVAVTVAEHTVAVACERQIVTVSAGEQVIYGRRGIQPLRAVDHRTVLSWRDGRLVFIERPLREVLSMLEAWQSGRIVLMDDTIAALPITAIFDVRRSQTMLVVLARGMELRIVQLTPYLTLVYGAKPPAPG